MLVPIYVICRMQACINTSKWKVARQCQSLDGLRGRLGFSPKNYMIKNKKKRRKFDRERRYRDKERSIGDNIIP